MNEISIDNKGNATVFGSLAHLLWDYCKGCFPRTKCGPNNFYVLEHREFPQGYRWDVVAGHIAREDAIHHMGEGRVLVDVTNAPRA